MQHPVIGHDEAKSAVTFREMRIPTETMVRILLLKRLHNLSDEQVEFRLLDRLSFQRFCGLTTAANIPDRKTVWNFENRIAAIGAQALFDSLNAQLLGQRYLARGG